MIMKYKFIPYESIGPFQFMMPRKEVRNKVESTPREFKKSKFSKNTTDAFEGFHAFYTQDDKLEAIEFFNNDVGVLLNDDNLFDYKLSDLKKMLADNDPDMKVEDGGFISFKYGVAVSNASSPTDEIESILTFRKGYYD